MNSIQIDLTDRIPEFLLKAAMYVEKKLRENGFEVYLVGGSVRDLILKRNISDLDFTTNAHPAQMKKIFPKIIPVGEKFGTILVLYHGRPIEVTTYRSDGVYSDGRRPETVSFGHSLEEDVMRRDFTINGMAYQLSGKLLIDHVGGQNDIEAGIIRTIGDPMARFREDGLRPIRGCRMMANLGFRFDPDTEAAMNKNIGIIAKVAPERFYDEWKKTLKIKSKHDYWNALKRTGIFGLFFPEFKHLNFEDAKWNNLMQAIEHSMPRNMAVYTAHFFYQEFGEENSYAVVNKEGVKNLMKVFFDRNRFPLKTQKLCASLLTSPLLEALDTVGHRLGRQAKDQNPGEQDQQHLENSVYIKKALANIDPCDWMSHLRFTKEILYRHHLQHKRDTSPQNDRPFAYDEILGEIIGVMRDYRRKKFVLYINELDIDGNDLKEMGFEGKQIGSILHTVLDYVIYNPDKNRREDIKKFIKSNL